MIANTLPSPLLTHALAHSFPSLAFAMIKLGFVKYLNTLPLVEGLQSTRDLELTAAVPSRLADLLATSEVDIALASLVDLAACKTPLTLIPAGMIGCDGPTLTVRLFSSVPLSNITRLAVDTDSHTSVILAQVILARVYNTRPAIIPFDARERAPLSSADDIDPSEWPEALLIIGDKVVTDSPPAVRYPHQLDLGEAWKALTGLPFVYAMWMCRTADTTADSSRRDELLAVAALLDRQRRRNTMRLDWIIERYAHERRWPRDLASRYFREYLRYAPDARALSAVERFLGEAAGLGLLPDVRTAVLEF